MSIKDRKTRNNSKKAPRSSKSAGLAGGERKQRSSACRIHPSLARDMSAQINIRIENATKNAKMSALKKAYNSATGICGS